MGHFSVEWVYGPWPHPSYNTGPVLFYFQVVTGLKKIHDLEVAVIDLKADNVLMQKTKNRWQAILTDFSIGYYKCRAVLYFELNYSKTELMQANPHYAPEVLDFNIWYSADIFSMGRILGKVCTKSLILNQLLAPLTRKCLSFNLRQRPSIKQLIIQLRIVEKTVKKNRM